MRSLALFCQRWVPILWDRRHRLLYPECGAVISELEIRGPPCSVRWIRFHSRYSVFGLKEILSWCIFFFPFFLSWLLFRAYKSITYDSWIWCASFDDKVFAILSDAHVYGNHISFVHLVDDPDRFAIFTGNLPRGPGSGGLGYVVRGDSPAR